MMLKANGKDKLNKKRQTYKYLELSMKNIHSWIRLEQDNEKWFYIP